MLVSGRPVSALELVSWHVPTPLRSFAGHMAMALATMAAALVFSALCSTIDVRDCGAVPNLLTHNLSNAAAISRRLSTAAGGGTVVIPAGLTFYTIGGIHVAQAKGLTLRIDGKLAAVADLGHWPVDSSGKKFLDVLHMSGCEGLRIVGNGTVDGMGVPWWNKWVLAVIKGMHSPHLILLDACNDTLVHGITMLNSPNYHLLLSNVARAEVGYARIEVDRRAIHAAKARQRQLRAQLFLADTTASITAQGSGGSSSDDGAGPPPPLGNPMLQPEDLNTDGIDPSGSDVWIHDSFINNDDDSIAVKPCTFLAQEGPCATRTSSDPRRDSNSCHPDIYLPTFLLRTHEDTQIPEILSPCMIFTCVPNAHTAALLPAGPNGAHWPPEQAPNRSAPTPPPMAAAPTC
jgi:hypothetical protein